MTFPTTAKKQEGFQAYRIRESKFGGRPIEAIYLFLAAMQAMKLRVDRDHSCQTPLEVSNPKRVIVQEEVFGPVLPLQVFDTEAQAVALANDSEYGLAASVWSRDADRPLRVARSIQAGTVWINDWMVLREGQAAYLGKKAAGEQ
jgi:hypothetical protein